VFVVVNVDDDDGSFPWRSFRSTQVILLYLGVAGTWIELVYMIVHIYQCNVQSDNIIVVAYTLGMKHKIAEKIWAMEEACQRAATRSFWVEERT